MAESLVRIAMTQPYVPNYRVKMFDLIHDHLADHGFEFRVFWGCGRAQRREIDARSDSGDGPWAEEVTTHEFPAMPGNPFVYRKIPAEWSSGLLVTEMQVTNLNAWGSLTRRRPYVTVGHGKSYLGPEPKAAIALESTLNRHAAHVCTYTDEGRKEVLRRTGVAPSQVTAFRNATAAASGLDRSAPTSSEILAFRRSHGIPEDAKLAFFIGALAQYKRIDLLVDAFRLVLEADSDWWLVVAGDGPEKFQVDSLRRETGRVTALGNTSPSDAAVPALSSRVIVNPGRVGLVAVDALAWKLPVLTTWGAPHAPEFDYLTTGQTVFVSDPTAVDFAEIWISAEKPATFPDAPSVEEAARLLAQSFMTAATHLGA